MYIYIYSDCNSVILANSTISSHPGVSSRSKSVTSVTLVEVVEVACLGDVQRPQCDTVTTKSWQRKDGGFLEWGCIPRSSPLFKDFPRTKIIHCWGTPIFQETVISIYKPIG